MLTRDQILAAEDMKTEDVPVPEWGGSVRVRTMTGLERQQFQKDAQKDGEPKDDFMERLLVACVVDADGKPLFTKKDIEALSGKSAAALERVFKKAATLNGLTSEAQEALKGE